MWDEICEDALSRIDLNHGENWTEARVSTPLHNHTQGKKVRMSKEGFHQILDNLIDDKWIRAKHRGQTSAIIEFHQSSDKSQKISWLKARGLRVEQNPFRHH